MTTSARADGTRRRRDAHQRDKAPVREKGLRTRRRILDAAAEVFAQDGYLNARVADIAQRANVAHSSFYTYFDSKEDVFRSLAQGVHAEMRAAIADAEKAGPMRERLQFANARYIEAYERHAVVLGLIEQVATFDAHFRDLRADLRGRFVAMLERAVLVAYEQDADGQRQLDSRTVASVLGAMIEHFAYTWFVLKEPYDREAAMATLDAVCLRTLGLDGPAREEAKRPGRGR